MRPGIGFLVLGYVLSQFYRAFLAVMSPVLKADLGTTADDLAAASGLWFLAFALVQLPIGAALDRVGPRWTASVLMGVGAAGAAVFAMATTPFGIKLAMGLIGVGCAPVLMASYYIFARSYAPAVFGSLAGATIGIGALGNIAASVPLTAAMQAFGWRETVWALAGLTAATALAIAVFVKDPARTQGGVAGSLTSLLRMPALWPILAMMVVCYAPVAAIRGLWVGPYFTDVFRASPAQIGTVGLWMGLAMVAGNLAYGPLDRVFHSRKRVILAGNALTLACLGVLWIWPTSQGLATVALIGIGFFGASFPMVVAHGRAFFPPHLMGRGVTLLNLFGIAPIGIAQLITGRLSATAPASPPEAAYTAIFAFFTIATAIGLAIYLLSQDRTD